MWSGRGRGVEENGSDSKRRCAGRANGRIALGMETPVSVRKSRRLAICLSAHERPTALLARHAVAVLRQAGLATCQGDEAGLVSHLPAHVWNAPERERRKSEGRTGVAAPRESESHYRRLHAGSRSAEARGTEQFGQIGKSGRRFGNQARLSGSNWIMKENTDFAEPVYFVGVPEGI